nr:CopD family protein [Paenibacillus sp. GSMTC-2017]
MFIITQLGNIKAIWLKWALAFAWCLSIVAHGWASHPASFTKWGLLYQSVHVASLSIWLGTLIIVAWFTRGDWNWKAFVRWFTPMSIGSMILITFAGIMMMFIIVDNYINSWGINYGEALLLKHLVFLPLLLLAFMNGFMTKLTDQGRNERKLQWWLRVETVIALLMLMITAYLGVQEPPHEGEFEDPKASSLFKLLNGNITDMSLQWHWNLPSLALILLGLVSLAMLMMSYKREKRGLFILLTSFAIVFPFLGLLLAVQ